MFKGKGFEISDEIYTFRDPYSRKKLHILLSIDWENANLHQARQPKDNDYALLWIRQYGEGRVFYWASGHVEPSGGTQPGSTTWRAPSTLSAT